ncbi:hypothetical protein [Entomohabitans teleogrylli]|uniref:hypothetical protein n=1 Tax=Entomohabitans teleogrylli TaxID=1384589 RepID=UPI00073D7465|nr:hypothetical protein [Entomohabitans teleogrylli]
MNHLKTRQKIPGFAFRQFTREYIMQYIDSVHITISQLTKKKTKTNQKETTQCAVMVFFDYLCCYFLT